MEPPEPVEPPLPEEPPVPEGVIEPEPCKVVTLCASRVTESEPPEAVTVLPLARLLLEEVVKVSYELMSDPETVIVIDFDEVFVFTATMTTSVSPLNADKDTPDVGLSVASTR